MLLLVPRVHPKRVESGKWYFVMDKVFPHKRTGNVDWYYMGNNSLALLGCGKLEVLGVSARRKEKA